MKQFDQMKVYDNPFHKAFAPTEDIILLSGILSEINWKHVDDDKITKYKWNGVKNSKVLKKERHGRFTYYLTDYFKDDIFYGQIFVFHSDTDQFVGELGIAKWNGDSDEYLEGLVDVHPDFRRKGIATHMYNIGGGYFNKKFKQAPSSTDDAKKFWKDRK